MQSAARRNVEIVLVEGNPREAELTLHAVMRAGVSRHVHLVRSVAEAWDVVLSRVGSCILFLDADLPDGQALDYVRRLRLDERTAALPVVLLAASREDAKRVEEATGRTVGIVVRSVDYDAFLQSITSTASYWSRRLSGSLKASADTLDILLVEDSSSDADLVRQALRRALIPCTVRHVSTHDALQERLRGEPPDIVLADYYLPTLDGPTSLALTRAKWPNVPFVVVSGTMRADLATEILRQGATDYVLKDRMERLGPVVYRALLEAEERMREAETEEALRRSEEQLRQAQKLEAIGRLASGVAHDFNNILVTMSGCSELMLMRLAPDDSLRREAKAIFDASKRAAGLTKQLLAFGRKQVLAPKTMNLNAVVGEMEDMIRRLVGEDVALSIVLANDLGSVNADPGQMGQVLLNLTVNAKDAMPRGGCLTIRTDNVPAETTPSPTTGRRAGPSVRLTVADTGCGMDEETLGRLFEPFFTTKAAGKGSGLGLATVYGIVTQSGGHIDVRSAPNQGTTFEVFLPRVDVVDEETPAAPREAQHGSETLLLVEDDEPVRELTARILDLHGYRVLRVANGAQALRVAAQHPGRIDLLLTDVVLPGMSGRELVERIAEVCPGIRVVYVSGYAEEATFRYGVPASAALIRKPFTTVELTRRVREVLDEEGPAAASGGPTPPVRTTV